MPGQQPSSHRFKRSSVLGPCRVPLLPRTVEVRVFTLIIAWPQDPACLFPHNPSQLLHCMPATTKGGSNICVIACLCLGITWGPFLVSTRWNIGDYASGNPGNAPEIPFKPYSYQVCKKLNSGVCHLPGKGKSHKDTVLSLLMYLQVSGCILC